MLHENRVNWGNKTNILLWGEISIFFVYWLLVLLWLSIGALPTFSFNHCFTYFTSFYKKKKIKVTIEAWWNWEKTQEFKLTHPVILDLLKMMLLFWLFCFWPPVLSMFPHACYTRTCPLTSPPCPFSIFDAWSCVWQLCKCGGKKKLMMLYDLYYRRWSES